MLNHITQYINTRLLTTGYFVNLYEYVELKDQKDNGQAPMYYCGNGEYKDIDTEKNLSYIRLLRAVSITESPRKYRSGEVVLNVVFPIRIVGLVRNVQNDDSYKSINLAGDISKVVSANAHVLTPLLNARTVDFIPVSSNPLTQEVYKSEFPNTRKEDARYEYSMAAVDFNVVIDITQECWALACGNTITNCNVLNAALTKDEKNICILPTYDFSLDEVFDNLTPQQLTDLSTRLC